MSSIYRRFNRKYSRILKARGPAGQTRSLERAHREDHEELLKLLKLCNWIQEQMRLEIEKDKCIWECPVCRCRHRPAGQDRDGNWYLSYPAGKHYMLCAKHQTWPDK